MHDFCNLDVKKLLWNAYMNFLCIITSICILQGKVVYLNRLEDLRTLLLSCKCVGWSEDKDQTGTTLHCQEGLPHTPQREDLNEWATYVCGIRVTQTDYFGYKGKREKGQWIHVLNRETAVRKMCQDEDSAMVVGVRVGKEKKVKKGK